MLRNSREISSPCKCGTGRTGLTVAERYGSCYENYITVAIDEELRLECLEKSGTRLREKVAEESFLSPNYVFRCDWRNAAKSTVREIRVWRTAITIFDCTIATWSSHHARGKPTHEYHLVVNDPEITIAIASQRFAKMARLVLFPTRTPEGSVFAPHSAYRRRKTMAPTTFTGGAVLSTEPTRIVKSTFPYSMSNPTGESGSHFPMCVYSELRNFSFPSPSKMLVVILKVQRGKLWQF